MVCCVWRHTWIACILIELVPSVGGFPFGNDSAHFQGTFSYNWTYAKAFPVCMRKAGQSLKAFFQEGKESGKMCEKQVDGQNKIT